MFYYLSGELVYRDQTTAAIDCGGVAYRLTVSMNTSEALSGKMNARVKLFTYLQVREDGVELFGFLTQEELSTFRMLIAVSGVGPKAAMSLLSLFTPERFRLAVCTEDTKGLAKAPNIGAKTAARIVLELRDKITQGIMGDADSAGRGTAAQEPATGVSGKLNDALQALMTLGYDRSESLRALNGIDTTNLEVNEMIAQALKKFL